MATTPAPPRELPPATARAAAHQLSQSILNGVWTWHLRALGNTLLFDRNPYALATAVDDGEQLPTTRVLWLTCHRWTQTHLLRASEALALIQLVRELDPAPWVRTLRSLWSEELDANDVTDDELATTPVTLGLAVKVETAEHMDWVFERLVGSKPFSSSYCTDFEALQEALGVRAHQAAVPRIAVSLKLHEIDRLGPRDRLYEQLLQIAIMQERFGKLTRFAPKDQLQSIQGKQERMYFQVVKLDLDGPAMKDFGEEGLVTFGRIAPHGVRLARLFSLRLDAELRPPTTQALRALIPAGGNRHRQYFGVEEVFLSDSCSLNMIAPVLSALQVSQSVRKVSIAMHSDERIANSAHRRTLWKWIAYALFSSHARHNIQEIELNIGLLGKTDVAALQAAVLLKNPLEGLLDSAQFHRNQFVGATRFFMEGYFKLYPLSVDTLTVVRVFASGEKEQADFWRVILPGCGVALVHKDDAIEMPEHAATHEDNYSSFKQVTLTNCNIENESIGYAFLRALPCQIERITFIDAHTYRNYGGNCFVPVLTTCPGLKQLVTPPGLVDSPIMDVAKLAATGKCGLELLEVCGWINLRGAYHLIPFFEVLADVDHPLSRNLCELELHVTDGVPENSDDFDTLSEQEEGEDDDVPDFVAAVHKMLTLNRRLHTVTLHLLNFDADDLIDLSDEEVAIRTAPLALRSKLAVLSVLRGSDTVLATVAASLDSAVLSIIFEFAAEHRIRNLTIA